MGQYYHFHAAAVGYYSGCLVVHKYCIGFCTSRFYHFHLCASCLHLRRHLGRRCRIDYGTIEPFDLLGWIAVVVDFVVAAVDLIAEVVDWIVVVAVLVDLAVPVDHVGRVDPVGVVDLKLEDVDC